MSVLLRFLDQGSLLVYLLQQFLRRLGRADDVGSKEDHPLGFVGGLVLFLEEPAEPRDAAKEGRDAERVAKYPLRRLNRSKREMGRSEIQPKTFAMEPRIKHGLNTERGNGPRMGLSRSFALPVGHGLKAESGRASVPASP